MSVKRCVAALLTLLLLAGVCPAYASAAASDEPEAAYHGFIVTLQDNAAMLFSAVSDADYLGFDMYYAETPEAVCTLADTGAVTEVEPNYCVRHFGATEEPGYTRQEQWYLHAYPGLGAADAWAAGLDGSGVTVAVLDTGVFGTHEDFENTIFVDGCNATGDGGSWADMSWHGTGVTGVIAASVNDYGLVGAAHGAQIMPVRVFDRDGKGYISYIVAGFRHAVTHGADIINTSFGTETQSNAMVKAVNAAIDAGVIVIAAAGNDGNTILNYPAAIDRVIGVGAIDAQGEVTSFSQKNQSVWVTAPGTDILTTYSQSGYHINTEGTSFSSPCVAALAALAKQYANDHQQSLTPEDFKQLLRLTAIDSGDPGYNYRYGHGTVTAGRMLEGLAERSVQYVLGENAAWNGTAPVTTYIPYSQETVCLTAEIPRRDDHFFGGWYAADDFSGSKATSFLPAEALIDRVYYAKWIENVTELDQVTLDGYAAEPLEDGNWIVYLPAGMDMPGKDADVDVHYAYSGTLHQLGHKVTWDSDGHWSIGMTQNTSDDVFEDTYHLTVDNTTCHAPTRLTDAVVYGTARPMSLDAATPPELYVATLSDWFADEDVTDTLCYSLTVDGEAADAIVGLRIEDGVLYYKPPVALAGTEVHFSITATDGRFESEAVAVSLQVAALPVSTPTLAEYEGSFDAAVPADLLIGFTAYDNLLCSLSADGEALTPDTDYTVYNGEVIDGDSKLQDLDEPLYPTYVTLKADFMSRLRRGEHTVQFRFDTDSVPEQVEVAYVLRVNRECTEHDWDDGEITMAPGCESPGEKTCTCRNCGVTCTEVIAATGHVYVNGACISCGARLPTPPDNDPASPETTTPPQEDDTTNPTQGSASGEEGRDTSAGAVRTKTVTAADGSVTTIATWADGRKVTTSVTAGGDTYITVKSPSGLVMADVALPKEPDAVQGFADVARDAWYQAEVRKAVAYGLFNGTSAGSFSPERSMTRSMLLSTLYRLSGQPHFGTDTGTAPDAENAWYTNAVSWGYAVGITTGIGRSEFAPEQLTSREQIITMLYRFAGLLGAAEAPDQRIAQFTDSVSVSSYAADAMVWAVSVGLISGRETSAGPMLAPGAVASRAEAAVFCMRFIELLKQ